MTRSDTMCFFGRGESTAAANSLRKGSRPSFEAASSVYLFLT